MNQIQNWFINSRKRFLGPLKSEIEKDDISGNIESSVHQSLPVKPSLPLNGGQGNLPVSAIIPQNMVPPVYPFPIQYDQKDPTIALNIPDNSQKNEKIDIKNVNSMIMQMNQLQAMWIKSNPIFSYYNQLMMQQQMTRSGMGFNGVGQFNGGNGVNFHQENTGDQPSRQEPALQKISNGDQIPGHEEGLQ